jgi:hypothetical protein
MDSNLGSESDLSRYESVRKEIDVLRYELYGQFVVHIRNEVGCTKGLSNL